MAPVSDIKEIFVTERVFEICIDSPKIRSSGEHGDWFWRLNESFDERIVGSEWIIPHIHIGLEYDGQRRSLPKVAKF